MGRRKTPHQKRKLTRDRKALDRAILRLTRTFYETKSSLDDSEQRELLGLVNARRRVG